MKAQHEFNHQKAVRAFFILSLSYLLLGLIFGMISGFQYIIPGFLKDQLSFQKTRPLHVYLVISWIFTAAQAGIYYYLPAISGRKIVWLKGMWIHFWLQFILSGFIIVAFFNGNFGGREYLEFPPLLGLFILVSWVSFVINFFATLKPDFKTAPVYIWFWSTGILFFFITVSESYLWVFDYFKSNIVRDITVQWKALGSMVGSWNMLVYGTGMYVMEKMSGDTRQNKSPVAFFFYFLGLTNLMFNWGHHTYIVPAAPWIKTVAYIISMTELLILGFIILNWKKTLSEARKNYHLIPYRLLSFADGWIFLNLAVAIAISVPALNYYTHGTHITVAHAMGSTIGINTMILFASVFYILKQTIVSEKSFGLSSKGIILTNISLLFFWVSLIGSGIVKISGKINNKTFHAIMQESNPWFQLFAYSGVVVAIGLLVMILSAIKDFSSPGKRSLKTQEVTSVEP